MASIHTGNDKALGRQDSASVADGPFSPSGIKVLVVDDDPMCLKVVSAMLQRCNYRVVTKSNGHEALALLRQRNEHGDQFDLVLSDVYMPDMDGFRLLEAIGLELDLPVIMMSSDSDTSVVLRGVTHGAVDFLIKPVRIEELRNVWQHVVRRRSVQLSRGGDESAAGDADGDSRIGGVKRKDAEPLRAEHETLNGSKKARVVWSVEMHQQFVNAVNALGIDKAVPKRILELMSVEGLTRENVASHLQKYRLYLKRVEGVGGKGGRGSGAASGATAPRPPPWAAAEQQTTTVNNGTISAGALAPAMGVASHPHALGVAPPPPAGGYMAPPQGYLDGLAHHHHMAAAAAWREQQHHHEQMAAATAAGALAHSHSHPHLSVGAPMSTQLQQRAASLPPPFAAAMRPPPQFPLTVPPPPVPPVAQPGTLAHSEGGLAMADVDRASAESSGGAAAAATATNNALADTGGREDKGGVGIGMVGLESGLGDNNGAAAMLDASGPLAAAAINGAGGISNGGVEPLPLLPALDPSNGGLHPHEDAPLSETLLPTLDAGKHESHELFDMFEGAH